MYYKLWLINKSSWVFCGGSVSLEMFAHIESKLFFFVFISVCQTPLLLDNDTLSIYDFQVVGIDSTVTDAISSNPDVTYYLRSTERQEFITFNLPFVASMTKVEFDSQFVHKYQIELLQTGTTVPEVFVSFM